MKKVKILVPFWSNPHFSSSIPLLMKNLSHILEKEICFDLVWFLYMPEKTLFEPINTNEKFLDIHNFQNALDVLESEKPDLILASPSFNFIDLAFCIVGKKKQIPVVSIINPNLISKMMPVKNTLSIFFSNSVSTDNQENKKSFMRHGKFLFLKFQFLLNSQRKSKINIFKIIKDIFLMLKLYLNHTPLVYHPNFSTKLYCLGNQSIFKKLINNGFNPQNLVITGIPMYDMLFKKSKNIIKQKKSSRKNILFAPGPLYEHGYTTKKTQDKYIKLIIQEILKSHDNINLNVKIHPHASNLHDYQILLNEFNKDISIFQEGDILEYLSSSDILITFPGTTTTLNAALLKIPTILVNFIEFENDPFVKNSLAFECNDIKSISKMIDSLQPIEQNKLDKFIEEFFYKNDGNASNRVCSAILKLILKL